MEYFSQRKLKILIILILSLVVVVTDSQICQIMCHKVLALKLLDGASVSENQRQMCLTLANDLTYNSMKAERLIRYLEIK